jgi:hypothetical protein
MIHVGALAPVWRVRLMRRRFQPPGPMDFSVDSDDAVGVFPHWSER